MHTIHTPREIFEIKGSLKDTKTRKQPEHGLIRSPESLAVTLAHIITIQLKPIDQTNKTCSSRVRESINQPYKNSSKNIHLL